MPGFAHQEAKMERSEYLSETKDSPNIGLTISSHLYYIRRSEG